MEKDSYSIINPHKDWGTKDDSPIFIKRGDEFYGIDMDLWHVIKVIKDDDINLILVKSWTNHKKRWVYKIMREIEFATLLRLTKQFIKKEDGYYVEKVKPKTYDLEIETNQY